MHFWQSSNKTQERESVDSMVRVSSNFDGPRPSYAHFSGIFRPPAGHGRAENCKTESDLFGSDSKNSKNFVILNTNKGKTFFSDARARYDFFDRFLEPGT